MNFLAHTVLGSKIPPVLVGNIIADYLRGQHPSLPVKVQFGIQMHRQIDVFTDKQPEVKEIKSSFAQADQRYIGIVLDVFFDHLLAESFKVTTGENLDSFLFARTKLIQPYLKELPESISKKLTNINWMSDYIKWAGMVRSCGVIQRRSKRNLDLLPYMQVLWEQKEKFRPNFDSLWAKLQIESDEILKNLPEY